MRLRRGLLLGGSGRVKFIGKLIELVGGRHRVPADRASRPSPPPSGAGRAHGASSMIASFCLYISRSAPPTPPPAPAGDAVPAQRVVQIRPLRDGLLVLSVVLRLRRGVLDPVVPQGFVRLRRRRRRSQRRVRDPPNPTRPRSSCRLPSQYAGRPARPPPPRAAAPAARRAVWSPRRFLFLTPTRPRRTPRARRQGASSPAAAWRS